MAQHGVSSRREARELAKNHGSVRGHELMQKTWKDAVYGAALMVNSEIEKVEAGGR